MMSEGELIHRHADQGPNVATVFAWFNPGSPLLHAFIVALVLAWVRWPLPGAALGQSRHGPVMGDRRTAYDVLHYALQFRVDPGKQRLDGVCLITLRITNPKLDSLVLDASDSLHVHSVRLLPDTTEYPFKHHNQRLSVPLSSAPAETLRVRVSYSRTIPTGMVFAQQGIGMTETPSGLPWIATSCQLSGAHSWWPCKASFFHPEDKPDSLKIVLTFPDTLDAVTNGRLLGEDSSAPGWKTQNWRFSHPLLTYLVALYIGPYVDLRQRISLANHPDSLTLHYYVLKGSEEKARREFTPRIPEELKLYEQLYGPFAFVDEKFALVQSPYPGMEHSTAVAVGPIFPHTLKPGEPNPLAWYEDYFNYMAVHEVAHEWWGNAVSALNWGEFWLHEGFATFTEALWVEHLYGQEVMHQYMARLSFRIDSTVTVYRPRHKTAREAYHLNIYWKGAWVLHMLRYVIGDSLFFQALRAFNTDPRYRYGNACTADFQRTCERFFGQDLSWFFLEWVYRPGHPHFTFSSQIRGNRVHITVQDTSFCSTRFRMPLDVLVTTEKGKEKRRLWVEPGTNTYNLRFDSPVHRVDPVGLRWILDGPKTGALWYFTDLDFIKGEFLNGLEFTDDRRIFVSTDSSAWESPARSLFQGAKWGSIRLDVQQDPRFRQVKILVRPYAFFKHKRKPWLALTPEGTLPDSLREVPRLQYRLDFGKLVGQTLPIPRVVVQYSR